MSAYIIDGNAICSAGSGAEQIWASVRAGISRIGTSAMVDRNFDEIQMALVPDVAMPALPPDFDALPLPPRARRMLRLAAPTLAELAESAGPEPMRLFLAVPRIDAKEESWISSFALHLAKSANIMVDAPNCRVVPAGRAGGLMALELALATLASGQAQRVVVGGVDSFFDFNVMSKLVEEKRVLGPRIMDGFIPGEAAAFYVLSANEADAHSAVRVLGAASVRDPGHRYGQETARGEGLANAINALRDKLGAPPVPIGATFAGFNGESFEAKLWGVAALRHRDIFDPQMCIEHPADCFGDTGAAAGPLLTMLAHRALSLGHRKGPALVWAASDYEPRACALLGN